MIIKNIFQIYTLLVCLISTIVLMIAFGMLLNSFTDLLIPQYTRYSTLQEYESRESYINRNKEFSTLSPPQIDEKRIRARKEYLQETKGRAIEGIIHALQWALVGIIFFFVHWRLYKRSKENERAV
jgi:hypothetical protein